MSQDQLSIEEKVHQPYKSVLQIQDLIAMDITLPNFGENRCVSSNEFGSIGKIKKKKSI